MLTADQINTLIELRLREIPFPQTPVGLYDPARYILNGGGKHIRPTLAMLSSNLFTDDLKPCEDVALAMEVFHNFTLVHDDIMDNAPTRRGRATIHEKWDLATGCLLYTSDAADERSSVDLGGRRIIKQKKKEK